MERYLTDNLKAVFGYLRSAGHQCYAVGGCVRDTLMGYEPKDIDLCTDATPSEVREIFSHCGRIQIIPTGEKFGTLTLLFYNGEQYEITTYRADGRYEDGRHPKEVSFSEDLIEDLKRRDFTCNAIAWNRDEGYVDPFGGMEDIRKRIIRCVGNPKERFDEDALRILRLIRFAIKYEFAISSPTFFAAIERMPNTEFVSRERVGAELLRIFSYHLEALNQDGDVMELLRVALTTIFSNCRDLSWNMNRFLKNRNPLLRWYDCCIKSTEQETITEINKFAVGNEISSGVKNLKRAFEAYESLQGLQQKQVLGIVRTSQERKAFLSKIISEGDDPTMFVQAIANDEPYSIGQLAVDGNWVMREYNLTPGVAVKHFLQKVLNIVCDNPEFNRAEIIKSIFRKENIVV